MAKKEESFTETIIFRTTLKQKERLNKEFEKSIYPKKAQFLRAIFENHKSNPDYVLVWRATIAAGKLFGELTAHGNNLNQLLKAINAGHIAQLSVNDMKIIQNEMLRNKIFTDLLIKLNDI